MVAISEAMKSGVAVRALRELNRSLTTPSVWGSDESCSRPVITNYSTSPARHGSVGYVIVNNDVIHEVQIVRYNCFTHNIETFKTTLKETVQPIDTVSDTQWFRDSLSLSMAEIAALFGVTRKAVYDWLDGAKTNKAEYIKAVRSSIEQNLPADLHPYLRQFWEYRTQGTVSLLDLLKLGEPARLGEEASAALQALKAPIADYVEKIRSKQANTTVSHVHNYDEYRNF